MLKTVEALISLAVLLSFLSFSLLHYPVQHSRLYEYELAGDAWRALYLGGGFGPVWKPGSGGLALGPDTDKLNADAGRITELTGLCVAMDGLQVASCLPGEGAIVLHKAVSSGGAPVEVLFRMGPRVGEGVPEVSGSR